MTQTNISINQDEIYDAIVERAANKIVNTPTLRDKLLRAMADQASDQNTDLKRALREHAKDATEKAQAEFDREITTAKTLQIGNAKKDLEKRYKRAVAQHMPNVSFTEDEIKNLMRKYIKDTVFRAFSTRANNIACQLFDGKMDRLELLMEQDLKVHLAKEAV